MSRPDNLTVVVVGGGLFFSVFFCLISHTHTQDGSDPFPASVPAPSTSTSTDRFMDQHRFPMEASSSAAVTPPLLLQQQPPSLLHQWGSAPSGNMSDPMFDGTPSTKPTPPSSRPIGCFHQTETKCEPGEEDLCSATSALQSSKNLEYGIHLPLWIYIRHLQIKQTGF